MNKREINFSDTYEIKVKVRLECFDSEVHGTLKLLEGSLPKLEFDALSGVGFGDIALSKGEKNYLDCKSETHTYRLHYNELLADDIWPRYVTENKSLEHTHGVEVLLSGLSEWIDQSTSFDITEREIRKDRPSNEFDEVINYSGKEYRISSKYNCVISKKKNRDFIVSETTTVSLVNTQNAITLEHAESLTYKVKNLFSLLLMAPLSIESVWLVDGEGKNRTPLYFSTISHSGPPYRNTIDCLIHPRRISNDIGWSTIFESYFSDEKTEVFENMWSRIPMLLSYRGTWDYQILGYVSILDSYCSGHSARKGKKLGGADYKSLRMDLCLVIDRYQESLGDEYKEVLVSFKEGINSIKNTSLPTFREKYNFMLSGVDERIRKIVNFSTDEFRDIKSIRDSAAHGLPIDTKENRDISYEFSLKDRLLVLLTYLVFRDMGISPIEFAKSLKYTFAQFVMNSGINTVERDKLAGTVPFWCVDKNNFDLAKESKRTYVGIEFDRSIQKYKFSSSVTNECQKWLSTMHPQNRYLIDYIKDAMYKSSDVDIEYIDQAYLVCGDEYIELSAVCRVSQ